MVNDDPFVDALRKLDAQKKEDLYTFVESNQGQLRASPPMKETDKVRASSIYDFCPRREVLKILDEITLVDEISPKLTRIFSVGRVYERYIRDRVLGDRKILLGRWKCLACGHIAPEVDGEPRYPKPDRCSACDSKTLLDAHRAHRDEYDGLSLELFRYVEETLVNDHAGVGGHADGFIYWGREYYVVDFKTSNNRRFNEMRRKGPAISYLAQLQIYMKITGIKKGILWFFNKDTSEEFLSYVDYDPAFAKQMNSKGYQMKDFWRYEIIPDRRLCPTRECARAKGCAVADLCFSTKYSPTVVHD